MLLTDKYAEQISAVLTCYDRIVIQGVVPSWCCSESITHYFYAYDMKIFDFANFSQPLTQRIRENAEQIARDNGIEIEFIRKTKAFRKDDRISEIISTSGKTEGLVHIFSAMESCNTFKPWHDKQTGKTFLKPDQGKCLHYYFYFIDKELGLCYLRVPTWCPFRLQFYMNGHNFLANKMKQKDISYETIDNAFSYLSDQDMAQKLSDRINPEDIHKALDVFSKRYCPVVSDLNMSYTWTIMQIECATDIIFKSPEYLQPMYDEIIRTAIFSVKPDNIATFLGQKITYNCRKEIGTNYNQRFLGTRIKHHMGDVSIKMYDKHGIVLRIESTCNDVGSFRVKRMVDHRDGTSTEQKAPMKKTIYSLYQLFTIMKAANYRYLEFISTFDDHSNGDRNLTAVAKSVTENNRSFRGLNFFDERDLNVLETIGRGEFITFGMCNKEVRHYMSDITSSAMSRIFKRLQLHGLIKRKDHSYKYFPTELGKSVITAGLSIRSMLIIPALTLD